MTTYQTEERTYPGYTYPRPGGSSHEGPSPERLHSSQGFVKGVPPPPPSPYQVQHDQPPPGSSHGYPPQPPITPLSGSNYPPQPPPSNTDSNNSYYGLTTPTQELKHIPSPPPSSSGGVEPPQFTPDGAPVVPVGVSGGKMFRCRGYGDCDKVFTRSEHLARHVRKHTGERPFPCHCGKAFSRLDNLRQHAATVHADQSALNEAMLNSLAHVHAALSQRANKEQRRRGEVVEVPKNAVERPRQMEQYRKSSQGPAPEVPYGNYPPPGPQFTIPAPPVSRPRTGGAYEYGYHDGQGQPPIHPPDEAGPSRRPASAGFQPYPPVFYDPPGTRPPTASTSAGDTPSHLPYPYRPMSSSGRDLPIPVHYAESEPPSSAHGPPPQSPMYPHPHMQAGPPQWTSPPAPQHSNYPPPPPPHPSHYPQQEGYPPHYTPPEHGHYGPPPPSTAASGYGYTPQPSQPPPPPTPAYYPAPNQQAYSAPPSTASQYPPPPPPQPLASYGPSPVGASENTYQFQPPPPQTQPMASPVYGYAPYDSRKRRSNDFEDGSRKVPRQSFDAQAPVPPPVEPSRPQEALWLPPTTERRSSLAISALLGSPQQIPRSRPTTADVPPSVQPGYSQPPSSAGFTYGGGDSATASSHSMPATPALSNIESKPDLIKVDGDMNMDQKAKALLSHGTR